MFDTARRTAVTVGALALVAGGALGTAAAAVAAPASPTSVADCSQRSDFLKVTSSINGTQCFANSGGNNVSIGGQVTFSSGNNHGYLLYYQTAQICNPGQCAPPSRFDFGPYTGRGFSFSGSGTGITYIDIS